MLPETDLARIWRYVDRRNERIRPEARDQIRIELDVCDRAVTILECRPPWAPERMEPEWTRFPIARLRYTKIRKEWAIYWRDRNLRFHLYDLAEPSQNVDDLLAEIDSDPTCIFWG